MARVYEDITATVGNTPLVRLNRMAGPEATVLAKIESLNPCGSVKDRIAVSMIDAAERQGVIGDQTVLVEPTSGNTGIGLAFVCAARGYKLVLTMPESMSTERSKLFRMLGAEVVLTDAAMGMGGAIQEAEALCRQLPDAVMLQQFTNPANPEAHRNTTGLEIWDDTDGRVDILVAGVGTGGTLTGCGEVLKAKNPAVRIVAVEPAASPVLSGGCPGVHKIQGIGAGFVPEILNTKIIDTVVQVSNQDAMAAARQMARLEGILGGFSAGAAVWAACRLSEQPENKGKTIVFIMCDTGERYLSTELFANLQ